MGRRGRRKGSNGEESRELLLRTATNEFASNGYHNTKISSIVKKANVTQPTFYLYFESKEAIFQELFNRFRQNLAELVQQSRLESGLQLDSLPVEIEQKLTAIFTFFKKNPNLTLIGFFIAEGSTELKQQIAKQIEANLRKEQLDGYFQPDIDMNMVAFSLIGMIERLTLEKLFSGLTEPNLLAKEIVHLLLYGMIHR